MIMTPNLFSYNDEPVGFRLLNSEIGNDPNH